MEIKYSKNRITFYRSGSVYPYIFSYEEESEKIASDKNLEKLITFFDKVISSLPEDKVAGLQDESSPSEFIYNSDRTMTLLTDTIDCGSEVTKDYQKSMAEFNDGEYADSVRDLGRATEALIELVCSETEDSENIPDNTGAKLDMLDKTSEGYPSFIGKTVSPVWWLRNKINHPTKYEITEEDALYAHNCFQTAVVKMRKIVS